MIGALIIYNICFSLLITVAFPLWAEITLSVIGCICTGVAFIVWEETKDRIKVLENKLRKMKGDE